MFRIMLRDWYTATGKIVTQVHSYQIFMPKGLESRYGAYILNHILCLVLRIRS